MTLDLYTLHSTPAEGEFIIQKFDTNYICQSVYAMTSTTCMCPQGAKPTCRHRKMFPLFLKFGHIGDGWFLEWNTRMWRRPLQVASDQLDKTLERMGTNQTEFVEMLKEANNIAEEMVSRPSVGAEAPSSASPPSPPEGPQPPQAAEAAPTSPVGVGAPIVKRRRVP
jgi:hypothetical protein